MTLSLAARCTRTGEFGVVITSSSPAVASRCAYVRSGVGAACSQNITDPRLGPALLDALQAGENAEFAIEQLVANEPLISFRQLTCVGKVGPGAAFSGEGTLGFFGTAVGRDSVAAANLLADTRVPSAMVEEFESNPEEDFGGRLVGAIRAGIAAGGEAGPVRSAGLLISGDVPWPTTDLRVDWSDEPIELLEQLWCVWSPQMADYISRALDPGNAPSYGVPGDPR